MNPRYHQQGFTQHHVPCGKDGAGFTLLGVTVAFAIASLVLGGVAGLGQRTGSAVEVAKARLIASLLAREGIELVRAMRDTNWLADHCTGEPCSLEWRGGSAETRDICNGTWRVDAGELGLTPATAGGAETRIYRLGLAYSHDESGVLTPFRRWVSIESAEAGCPPPASISTLPPPLPMTVRVTVAWRMRGGGERTVTLAEELYPWMRFR